MSEPVLHIGLVGSGNVATFFAKIFSTQPRIILHHFARNPQNIIKHTSGQNIQIHALGEWVASPLDLLLICVSDAAILDLAKLCRNQPHRVMAHTSGSFPASHIAAYTTHAACIYPMQSIHLLHLPKQDRVPLLIELLPLSISEGLQKIGFNCYAVTAPEKAKYHLLAVMVNNFGNHLLAQCLEFANGQELNYTLMAPLAEATLARFKAGLSAQTQTGPAKRNDLEVLHMHLKLLENYPDIKDTYRFFSQQLLTKFGHNESGI